MPLRPLLLAALVPLLAACDGVGPSEEPLPSVAELRERYPIPPPGQGVVREGEDARGDRYETSAVHATDSVGTLTTFYVVLVSEQPRVAISISLFGTSGGDLDVGDEFEANFDYGRGNVQRGGGVLSITAVDDGRVEGVFAADLGPSGLLPDFRRIRGSFNAVPEPAE